MGEPEPNKSDLLSKCIQLKSSVDELKNAIQEQGLLETQQSNGLLQLRNHQLVSYLTNLHFLACKKTSGQSIQSNPAIDHLVQIRTVLEKMRPITKKLQSQFDRLLQTNQDESKSGPGFNNLTPAADNLLDDDEMDSSGDDQDPRDKSKGKKYAPPRIAAMHYDGDNRNAEEKASIRTKDKHLLEELRKEQSFAPEEILDTVVTQKKTQIDRQRKRQAYEEDHLIRLRMSKREKVAERRAKDSAFLDSIMGANQRDVSKDFSRSSVQRSKSKRGSKPKKRAGGGRRKKK